MKTYEVLLKEKDFGEGPWQQVRAFICILASALAELVALPRTTWTWGPACSSPSRAPSAA